METETWLSIINQRSSGASEGGTSMRDLKEVEGVVQSRLQVSIQVEKQEKTQNEESTGRAIISPAKSLPDLPAVQTVFPPHVVLQMKPMRSLVFLLWLHSLVFLLIVSPDFYTKLIDRQSWRYHGQKFSRLQSPSPCRSPFYSSWHSQQQVLNFSCVITQLEGITINLICSDSSEYQMLGLQIGFWSQVCWSLRQQYSSHHRLQYRHESFERWALWSFCNIS